MGLFDTWDTLNATAQVTPSDRLRIHIGFSCHLLAFMSKSDFQQAMQAQPEIGAVLSVSEDVSDALNPFSSGVTIEFNPKDLRQAGEFTAVAFRAYQGLNESSNWISCSDPTVDGLQRFVAPSSNPLTPSTPTAITVAAFAVLAVVAFLLLKEVEP
jgi:hypothetical protein